MESSTESEDMERKTYEAVGKVGGTGEIMIFSGAIDAHSLTLLLRSFLSWKTGNIHHLAPLLQFSQ